jgi:hypothetical protein
MEEIWFKKGMQEGNDTNEQPNHLKISLYELELSSSAMSSLYKLLLLPTVLFSVKKASVSCGLLEGFSCRSS